MTSSQVARAHFKPRLHHARITRPLSDTRHSSEDKARPRPHHGIVSQDMIPRLRINRKAKFRDLLRVYENRDRHAHGNETPLEFQGNDTARVWYWMTTDNVMPPIRRANNINRQAATNPARRNRNFFRRRGWISSRTTRSDENERICLKTMQ